MNMDPEPTEDMRMHAQISETYRMVKELHETVSSLLNSIGEAKAKGGIQGMMANQMFPSIPPAFAQTPNGS